MNFVLTRRRRRPTPMMMMTILQILRKKEKNPSDNNNKKQKIESEFNSSVTSCDNISILFNCYPYNGLIYLQIRWPNVYCVYVFCTCTEQDYVHFRCFILLIFYIYLCCKYVILLLRARCRHTHTQLLSLKPFFFHKFSLLCIGLLSQCSRNLVWMCMFVLLLLLAGVSRLFFSLHIIYSMHCTLITCVQYRFVLFTKLE